MASIPGVPGNLGQPANAPAGNSDHSLDLPAQNSGPITLVHESNFNGNNVLTTSGSFDIPGTGTGNLIVVLVSSTFNVDAGNPYNLTVSAPGETFTQVRFRDLVNDEYAAYGPGFMFGYTDGVNNSSMTQLDCWYAISVGGTVQIDWTCPVAGGPGNYLQPVIWVYELSGNIDWGVVQFAAAGTFTAQDQPYFGPMLSSSLAHNAYFTLITGGAGFNFGSAVNDSPSWILDPFPADTPLGSAACAFYIPDATGPQIAAVSASFDPHDIYQALGIVFGPVSGGGGGGGGGGTPPPDVDTLLPNVWIIS